MSNKQKPGPPPGGAGSYRNPSNKKNPFLPGNQPIQKAFKEGYNSKGT